jgi:hypothetical protein
MSITKKVEWNEEKNEWLKIYRKVSFEEVISCVNEGNLLYEGPHPNKDKYPHQNVFNVFIVAINDYAYLVPYVEDLQKRFLKTIIPTRKLTILYLNK